MSGSFRQIIDKAVAEKRFLVVPGAHDALSARVIQKIGFETYFIGGFPAVGARYGVPDIGLKGFGEISAAVRDIMSGSDLPVFVDGDDGYGDVKNVVHTVRSYERMGVSAILIEDQQWPKRCGHMAGKTVESVLLDMKSRKFAHRNDGMDFEKYKKVVGYDEWESIDNRFAVAAKS